MLGAPQTIRQIDERDIERRENCEDSGKGCLLFGIFYQAAEQQVGDEEQPEDEGGGELGVPGPPDTPDGTRPEWAGDQADGAAHHAYFDGGNAERVPFAFAGDEISNAGVEGDEEGAEHGVPTGYVEIEDALDGVHGGFIGRDEQGGITCAED